ncbi:hypothetical protein [Microbacterium sp. PRC9]|uniref:hypothetical protein n=1 Tax=Microbacterium sp. PRC9 TaxID=2962591 RepID=UPI002881748F|nr:hypothetical protein [Microbacterium sp. PRC9]MDT0144513.1 hypothetical protein [Microbacterium sp. PRC9]
MHERLPSVSGRIETRTIAADGVIGIAAPVYDALFPGGDAARGLAALIAADGVRINDTAVPTPRDDGTFTAERIDINGDRALWLNDDGTWSWNVQVLFNGENKTYDEAVVGYVDDITKLRGLTYRLTLVDGLIVGLDATIFDVAFARTVRHDAAAIMITLGGRGDTSTGKPDPSTLRFPVANVEGAPRDQDVVRYWKDAAGWHLARATPRNVEVAVTESADGQVAGTVDGAAIVDSRLTLQYAEAWNRPSQPIRAIAMLGETVAPMIQWLSPTGITIGFSRGDGARPALAAAIQMARDALAAVAVSVEGDGSDISSGAMWVTRDYHDSFAVAIADAAATFADEHATLDELEGALHRLAQAYGGRTGDRFSWMENRYFGRGDGNGHDAPFDTGHDGTGFWTFAQSHRGTAAA